MPNVAVVGLGYFSQFHLDAWRDHPGVNLVAVADRDKPRADDVAAEFGVKSYGDVEAMLAETRPAILDVVLPPTAQAGAIRAALKPGRTIICQKPFASSLEEAETLTRECEDAGVTLVIHENFRFQPWYRAMKSFLETGAMGEVYSAQFLLRPGDGRGGDAYLARQPSFQQMPRFLVQETAVHLIDTFRFLFGPITSVFAQLRRLNPAIKGEDTGHIIMTHDGGVVSHFDGNRLSDHVADDRRRTMGVMRIEGEGGTLELDGDGTVWFRAFDTAERDQVPISVQVDLTQFGGGCVAALINHVVDAHISGQTPENTARAYLDVLRLVEAAYQSNDEGRVITM